MASESPAIEQIHDQWIEMERQNQPVAVLELCASDVLWIPPDAPPIEGRDAVAAWLAQPGARVHGIRIAGRRIECAETMAWLRAEFHTEFTSPENGDLQLIQGTHLWILRKEQSVGWRVAVVSWSIFKEACERLATRPLEKLLAELQGGGAS